MVRMGLSITSDRKKIVGELRQRNLLCINAMHILRNEITKIGNGIFETVRKRLPLYMLLFIMLNRYMKSK